MVFRTSVQYLKLLKPAQTVQRSR